MTETNEQHPRANSHCCANFVQLQIVGGGKGSSSSLLQEAHNFFIFFLVTPGASSANLSQRKLHLPT